MVCFLVTFPRKFDIHFSALRACCILLLNILFTPHLINNSKTICYCDNTISQTFRCLYLSIVDLARPTVSLRTQHGGVICSILLGKQMRFIRRLAIRYVTHIWPLRGPSLGSSAVCNNQFCYFYPKFQMYHYETNFVSLQQIFLYTALYY